MAIGQYLGGVGMIAGGILGGLIGSPFGMTFSGAMIGASIGGAIGGIAGQVFWPEKISANFPPPPQPHENRQQISTYGAPIPIVYESGRLAGNIIYMQDINQTVTRTSHRQDGVRYYEITNTYASTFAIAFCEGPVIGISRIWVNGKVFADWRDPSGPYYPTGSTGLAAANLDVSVALAETWFSTYLGTETQTADTSLSALLTAAETPSYRGICYIVFRDFPVGEFSGVPNIEIEIGSALAPGVYDSNLADTDDSWFNSVLGGGGYWTYTDSYHTIGKGASLPYNSIFTFNNVTIPKGSAVSAATLQMRANGNYTNTLVLKFIGWDETSPTINTATVTGATPPTTTAYVDWTPGNWSDTVYYTSPDLSTIIQEIVGRADWVSGSNLSIFMLENGSAPSNYRSIAEDSAGPGYQPILHVEYIG